MQLNTYEVLENFRKCAEGTFVPDWNGYVQGVIAFREKLHQDIGRITEELAIEDYQRLWKNYEDVIKNYNLVFTTTADKKTTVTFNGQVVLTADDPREALRCVPEIVEMLHDVHRELLAE